MHFGLFCIGDVHKHSKNEVRYMRDFQQFCIRKFLSLLCYLHLIMQKEIEKRVNYYLSIFKFFYVIFILIMRIYHYSILGQ